MKIAWEKISLKDFEKRFRKKRNFYRDLTKDHWYEFKIEEQLANIGADISRAINRRNMGDLKFSRMFFFGALELLYLTIDDPKNKTRLKELCRLYEVLGDYFMGDNEYGSTDENLNNYFLYFNFLARKDK